MQYVSSLFRAYSNLVSFLPIITTIYAILGFSLLVLSMSRSYFIFATVAFTWGIVTPLIADQLVPSKKRQTTVTKEVQKTFAAAGKN